MKYRSEVVVDLPLMEVIKKFDSTENMKHWQRGLVAIEHVSGIPGMVGGKMRLHYAFGRRKMDLVETITYRNMPTELHGTYSTLGFDNFQQNHFKEMAEGRTKWTSTSEFLPLRFKTRALLWLMPKAFKKQSLQTMIDFKNFAEKGISVCDSLN